MGTYRANANVLGYEPGDEFEADEADVAGYLEGGHVEPVKHTRKAADKPEG